MFARVKKLEGTAGINLIFKTCAALARRQIRASFSYSLLGPGTRGDLPRHVDILHQPQIRSTVLSSSSCIRKGLHDIFVLRNRNIFEKEQENGL
jgi:hypothetical protein